MRDAYDTTGARRVIRALGYTAGELFLWLEKKGAIRVVGRGRAIQAVRDGRLIIAANHPSLVETLLIPYIFWPEALEDSRLFVWSMPARELFPRPLRLLYPVLRCIPIDRSRSRDMTAVRKALAVLSENGTVVMHPERGRTYSRKEKRPLIERCGRKLRPLMTHLPSLAAKSGAKILPLWIDIPGVDQEIGFTEGFGRLFRREYWPLTFSFGIPYDVAPGADEQKENRKLEEKILIS